MKNPINPISSPGEMQSDIIDNAGHKTNRKILGTPFRYLPNCRDFKIDLGAFEQEFLNKGIIKRTPADITIIPYRNGKLNRFARFQIIRLKSRLDQPQIF